MFRVPIRTDCHYWKSIVHVTYIIDFLTIFIFHIQCKWCKSEHSPNLISDARAFLRMKNLFFFLLEKTFDILIFLDIIFLKKFFEKKEREDELKVL